jgi:cysteine-rich repeat protein
MHYRTQRSVRLLPILLGLASFGAAACQGAPDTPPTPPTKAGCGNGIVDPGEQCDDGNAAQGDGCSATCSNEAGAACGNGAVDPGEQCDDGNTTEGDGCSAACSNEAGAACGDGAVDPGEQCDDGNTTEGDGCSAACSNEPKPAACGDGVLQAGEQCDDGNLAAADGCEADCSKPLPVEIQCGDLPPGPAGSACEVVPGDGRKLIAGTVLVPGTIYRGGQVLVNEQGVIACVGCDCAGMAAGATAITCPAGVISPGLINTHDHITYAHNKPPVSADSERFEHRHDWRLGLHCHSELSAAGGATDDEIRFGELRFLMGGATSTVGAGSATGLLRNLDKFDQEGLGQPTVTLSTFPLGDTGGTQASAGCDHFQIGSSGTTDAFLAHVSEGIDAYARNEFTCLSSTANGGKDLLLPKSGFIHALGVSPRDYAEMAAEGASLIWSPRSNVALYGDTAAVAAASRLGVKIALGTDWISSGSMNLLRELRCADSLDKTYFGGAFTDEDLWRMVTANAAEATATDDVIGTLAAGKTADIAIFRGDGGAKKDHRAIIDAEVSDVLLVLRGGKPLYGEAPVIAAIPGSGACDPINVCGAEKSVCLAGDIGKSLAALQTSASPAYPAFFCGEPENEPSCLPARPVSSQGSTVYTGLPSDGDGDGDGILNEMDNCPGVFNPIRPVDRGAQADYDADGAGDACDACPLSAAPAPCGQFTLDDADADSKPNATDNCATAWNPDQADADSDGKGNACDACPDQANPGGNPCEVSIYAVKSGAVPVLTKVSIKGALVTGKSPSGFYIQVKPGDAGYMGSDNSALFVYKQNAIVNPGDRVTIASAKVDEFKGQIELTSPIVNIDAQTGEEPEPALVTAAEVATCGPRARALEGVLVTVAGPTVTAITAPGAEFKLDGSLVVDDLLYLTDPFPKMGDPFEKISGILNGQFGNSKLAPRGPTDLWGSLSGFEPGLSFVYTGMSETPTVPAPLGVTLSRPAPADTFVSVVSADPSLTILGGGVTVPAGQTSALLLVSSGPTTSQEPILLTATYGSSTKNANVRVVDPSEVAVLTAMSPGSMAVPTGATATITVNLDIPAPAGGLKVALSLDAGAEGSIPTEVFVPEGEFSVTFDYTAGYSKQTETLTAVLGADFVTAVIGVVGRLTLNEVDYDQPGTDDKEFIEIHNDTGAPVDLAGYEIVLVNGGTNASYGIIDLSSVGALDNGQYLLVCWSDGVAAAAGPGALVLKPSTSSGKIQNGDALPDGIALINVAKGSLVDALSYKGSLTAAVLPGFADPVSLVEGTALTKTDSGAAPGSLCRMPDGMDKDDANTDWSLCGVITPGAPNAP